MGFMLRVYSCVIAAACLLSPRMARAAGESVPTIGLLGSFGRHEGGPASTGVGVEATFNNFPAGLCRYAIPCSPFFFGGVAQAETVSFDHARVMLGVQAGYFWGLELGPSIETTDGVRATTLDVHIAPFISLLGVVSAALRMNVPLAAFGAGPSYATDISAVVTLKVPLLITR